MLQIAALLLFVHFIGDFIFQSSDMAVNKATSIKWLLIHVAVYTSILFIASIFIFGLDLAITFALVNGGFHLVTDFFTSKLNAHLFQREDKRWYYSGIGFDQFIHGATLLLTYDYFIIN